MKPTVISTANANSSANSGNMDPNAHMNIPKNQEQTAATAGSYGSPRQQPHQIPAHFQQDFGFEPDMDIDMDMFPRGGRLGRMHHDPFAGFGGSHFGFPQFGSMSRRRAPAATTADPMMGEDSDFFTRLPSEFRQYIPDGFGHRRGGSGTVPHHTQQQQQMPPQYHQYQTGSTPPNTYTQMPPQSPSKKLCDAAIQTEDTLGAPAHDQVDHHAATKQQGVNLNQHGMRNTVDMGVKAPPEGEQHGPRAHSAPPTEQMQQDNNGGQTQFGPQTHSQTQTPNTYQKAYYPPQQQSHPMQKQRTPPPPSSSGPQPQTPGGSYVRTIPIFVEGRSEPIINAHKEIPNQNAPPQQQQQQKQQHQAKPPHSHTQPATGPQHHPPHPQQRPTPLNTQQQQQQQTATSGGPPPPQTPHTLDSINKIQDIQRDVLELMGKVEKFLGTRGDKEYAYLDEMLTRNLLKLDTIDTQGKDSIRLARKEAIKCIQASINVLEAKAEENAKTAQADNNAIEESPAVNPTAITEEAKVETSSNEQKEATTEADETKSPQEPIPLPPPAEEKTANSESNENATKLAEEEASPKADEASSENSATKETK